MRLAARIAAGLGRETAGARLLRAGWATRSAALTILGPALGLLIVAATFGLTAAMLRLALLMTLFALALLALLLRAEYRRLRVPPPPPAPPLGTSARR